MNKLKKLLILLITVFIVSSIFLGLGVNFFTDWLWFENLNFADTFWTIITGKIGFKLGTWLLVSSIVLINLLVTKPKVMDFWQRIKERKENQGEDVVELNPVESSKWLKFITPGKITLVYLFASLVIGFIFSNVSSRGWEVLLKFLNSTSFGQTDPLFSKDLGFYIFKYPFYNLLYQLLSLALILSGVVSGAIYLLTSSGSSFFNKLNSNHIKYHLSILLAIFFGLKAWGYRLDMFKLLYSGRGVVFGASYTDVNAQLLALKVLFVISIIVAIFIFSNIFFKNLKFIIGGVVALVVASLVLGNLYPTFIQQYQVEPNEINREAPYIKHNIEFTQQAYNLDEIEEREFPIEEKMTYEDITNNQTTVDNIRLWDTRPLKSTYGQLQEIRSYYSFNDIDVDRYKINGDLQQVMLGARELNQDLLPDRAQTWVNKRLNYTHGFGLAMSPVNKVTAGGQPEFIIQDVPPKSKGPQIKQPRIYYGELTNEYVVANTKAQEFDYPQGNKNKYYTYQGSGGIKLDSLAKKVGFALKYGTLKLLLNNDITADSRLMFRRNIKSRVQRVAPFLRYDQDPYLVIGDKDRLYWIQDAYTTTNLYPYSEPQDWGNYIRNSVKVVIDAYTGQMKFYVVDSSDPLIQTYQKIFPELFTAQSEMPQKIKDHLRYPVDLFNIQTQMYNNYHMRDPKVFYNKEDLWNIPQESYTDIENQNNTTTTGSQVDMEPYYILMNLSEEQKEEFLLMLPFTPQKKNNLNAWLAAKPNGELVLYRFSKQELIYGPMQIEARIDQDSNISKQLSLWNQQGSNVIRGNLLTIPLGKSLLYVEPIYLQAEQGELPELKRVIVSHGEGLAMARNLELAIQKLFGVTKEDQEETRADLPPETEQSATVKSLIAEIDDLYQQAQEESQAGNWSQYGELLQELEDKLNKLKDRVE
ncbi:UPF0182 family membrane protein [Halanaerobaculum tunisiense]